MPNVKTTANFSAFLSWSQLDTNNFSKAYDSGLVGSNIALINETGVNTDFAVNAPWHTDDVLSSGGTKIIDLMALPRDIFGETVTITMSKVRGLIVKNKSTISGETFTVSVTGSQGFSDLFGGNPYSIPVHPGSSVVFCNAIDGWDIDNTNNLIFLNDGGAGCDYSVALIGISG